MLWHHHHRPCACVSRRVGIHARQYRGLWPTRRGHVERLLPPVPVYLLLEWPPNHVVKNGFATILPSNLFNSSIACEQKKKNKDSIDWIVLLFLKNIWLADWLIPSLFFSWQLVALVVIAQTTTLTTTMQPCTEEEMLLNHNLSIMNEDNDTTVGHRSSKTMMRSTGRSFGRVVARVGAAICCCCS